MAAEKLATNVTTPEFRLSYPKLFKPELNKLSQKHEFSLEALFSLGCDLSQLKTAAKNACINKWGADPARWPKNLNPATQVRDIPPRSPFLDQKTKVKDGKLPDGCVEGAIFMRFKADGAKARPAIVDQNRQEILEERKVYAGCYVRANVTAFAYEQAGNVGVSFGLNAVQFVRDGQPFSGRPAINDCFEPIKVESGDGTAVTGSASDLF